MFGLIPNFLRGGGGGGSVVAGAACRDYDPTLASLHCTCPLLATTFTLDWTCFQKLVPVVLRLQHTLY